MATVVLAGGGTAGHIDAGVSSWTRMDEKPPN